MDEVLAGSSGAVSCTPVRAPGGASSLFVFGMSSGFGVGAASLCEGEGSSLFAFAVFRLGLLRALKQSHRSLLICMARQRATSSIVAARVIEGLAIKGRALETIAMLANVASDLKVMRFNTSHFRSARRWLGFSCLGALAHTYDWARRNSKQSIKLRSAGAPCFLWSLRSATYRATAIILLKKSILDLSVDPMEPLLSPLGSLLMSGKFCFQLSNPILGSAQLIRKLLSHAECVSAVFVGNSCGPLNQLQNSLTCLVELIAPARCGVSGRPFKRNYIGLVFVAIMHHTALPADMDKSYRQERARRSPTDGVRRFCLNMWRLGNTAVK